MINIFFKKEQIIKKIDFNILNDILFFTLKRLYRKNHSRAPPPC